MLTLLFKQRNALPLAIVASLLSACGSGASGGSANVENTTSPTPVVPSSVNDSLLDGSPLYSPDPVTDRKLTELTLSVILPQRIRNLGIPLEVLVTAGGAEYPMNAEGAGYSVLVELPRDRGHQLFIAVRRAADELILASASHRLVTDADAIPLAIPAQEFDTNLDYDSDGFTNIAELERGSSPTGISEDFDSDGLANETDRDDDNDGVPDIDDAFPLDASESVDTDGDGIGDERDYDDDNDLIVDTDDKFPLDPSESLDLDLDGIGNNADLDDDGDGVIDLEDPQPANASINGNEDTDSDGYRDRDDAFPFDPTEHNDVDSDGVGDNRDLDDDGNGIPDDQDNAIVAIPFTNSPPSIDGAYAWQEWSDAVSADSRGQYLRIDHLMIDNLGYLIDQDPEVDHRWRAMHDGRYLYLLVQVDNEPFYERHDDSADIWRDDGMEFIVDVGNEGNTTYDDNDFQTLLRYDYRNPDAVVSGVNSAPGVWVSYCSNLGLETPQTLHTYYEVKVSLSSIGLQTGQRFGFDVQINEDDNGGDRDAKWGWFASSYKDDTWHDPSGIGQAILIPER